MTSPPILSVSQAEKFDSEQTGGCPRRWWFEGVRGLRPDDTAAHEDGHHGHALLARYLTTGGRPGRVRLGKAVNAVIDSGALPRPNPLLEVEQRFSGQPHHDAAGAWVPLDVSRTLWHAGHPWEGFIDLRFRHRDGSVTVWDHKFSSDIHARALPGERLIRTVQMPIYALDTLRHWPGATAVNLVHLYVSRRGVESFIRHQRVSVEQVHERAMEIATLVQQMDAVRYATAQDDVPFNRAACHARAGCPHQFRCGAFKRMTMKPVLDADEMAMFGILSQEKPSPTEAAGLRPKDWDTRPFAEWPLNGLMCSVCGKPQRTTGGGAVCENGHGGADGVKAASAQGVGADLNLDDIFDGLPAPVASTPKPQPAPTCEACGEVLTPENSSRLKTGDMKHIGCAKGGINLAGGGAIVIDPLPAAAAAPKCPDCPHPPHAGKPCEGKRGRGACRCGVAVEAKPGRVLADGTKVEPSGKPQQSAAELQALADEAARAADVDGDGAAVAEAQDLQRAADEAREREEAPDANCITTPDGGCEGGALIGKACMHDPPPQARSAATLPFGPPSGSWSGKLAVNVTVELGPATLTFLAGLVKR